MADARVILDPELYLRSASRFAQKRSYLAPAAVESLARDVLTRLSRQETRVAPECDPDISTARLDAFCDVLIQQDPKAAQEFITAHRAEGVTRMEVYFGYISAAATRLGTKWDKSELSFMDVTIATGHLYALMRALRAEAVWKLLLHGKPAFWRGRSGVSGLIGFWEPATGAESAPMGAA